MPLTADKHRRARMRASIALACVCACCLLGVIYTLTPKHNAALVQSAHDAVKVRFIGESLCPDCAAFTTDVLEPVFAAGLNRHMQLDYVGWGNANNSSGSVTCQHGPRECELNKALNCAQRLAASQEAFFKFLYCLESTAFGSSSADVLQTCSGDASVDQEELRDCTYGSLGEKLEREAAAATPPHQYVPWILVDGVPLGADCGNLLAYICTAISGSKPDICYEVHKSQPCPGAPAG